MPTFRTPGIYIEELRVPDTQVMGVPTAVPAFIGCTEKAADPGTGEPAAFKPVAIASMAEFVRWFGGAHRPVFRIAGGGPDGQDFAAPDAAGTPYRLVPVGDAVFHLYDAMRLYFANGGGHCRVVSVGGYGKPAALADLKRGLDALAGLNGPTILAAPDACRLNHADYGRFATAMLAQCGQRRDRIALIDLCGSTRPENLNAAAVKAQVTAFHADIAGDGLDYSFGAAYYPALRTTTVGTPEAGVGNLAIFGEDPATADILADLLVKQAKATIAPAQLDPVMKVIAGILPGRAGAPQGTPIARTDTAALARATDVLCAALPVMARIRQAIVDRMNVQPPSGAMAGVICQTDAKRAVWSAPANVSLASVAAPAVPLTDDDQMPLATAPDGHSINVIRTFRELGPRVWGARTLDNNNYDVRYIAPRRTLIFIEQSIRKALTAYAVAANNKNTWMAAIEAVTRFLQSVWREGGLMGSMPTQAFDVRCDLGTTMTAQDVQARRMIVQVNLSITQPGEFIKLMFVQEVAGS
ncbi:MAG TPA: hypothetical protein VEB64_01095 [Azospirillaceae bacterium]|nr:hypothetical protein [Azospirillaceae bacterium]